MALRYYYNDDGDYSTLYAMTNAMGDVLGLYSVAGNPVVTYEYDAWGRLINLTDNTSLGTGTINPIRYRGYYYDTDSGLYYCQSRYYNPRVGRWVNADDRISDDILGANVFAYCSNNPVNNYDPTGHGWLKNLWNTVKNSVVDFIESYISDYQSPILANTTSGNSNKLPLVGEPNSTVKAPNGNERQYGPDGRAKKDTDYSHPEHHPELKNPHSHDWTWENGQPQRGDAYNSSIGTKAVGVVIIATSAVAIAWVVGNDSTGIGVFDDWTLPGLGGAFTQGVAMLFGGVPA